MGPASLVLRIITLLPGKITRWPRHGTIEVEMVAGEAREVVRAADHVAAIGAAIGEVLEAEVAVVLADLAVDPVGSAVGAMAE